MLVIVLFIASVEGSPDAPCVTTKSVHVPIREVLESIVTDENYVSFTTRKVAVTLSIVFYCRF